MDYIPHPLEAFCESHPMLGCEKTVPWSILKLAEQNYYPSTLNGTSLSMCLTDLSDLRYCSYFRRASRNALSPGFLVLCVRPGTLQSRPEMFGNLAGAEVVLCGFAKSFAKALQEPSWMMTSWQVHKALKSHCRTLTIEGTGADGLTLVLSYARRRKERPAL